MIYKVDFQNRKVLEVVEAQDAVIERAAETLKTELESPAFAEALRAPIARKPRERVAGMAWYPRLGLFKASNVTLDPVTLEAYSYGWWRFLERIGGRVVFNSFRYSVSTSKHQSKVRSYLIREGIDWIEIEAPKGLQDLSSALAHYQVEIDELQRAIAKGRPRKNTERREAIEAFRDKIEIVKKLLKGREVA